MATMTMPITSATADKLVSRFRTWADALQSKIDNACRPMTENPTPKRNCQYQRRLHDGRNLERTQKALRALADARESGTVPPELADLKTKNDIGELVHKGIDGSRGEYYSCIEASDYAETSEAARQLQAMIEGSSHEQAERERLRRVDALEAEIKLTTIPGYFPTPAPVVDLMLQRARISDDMKVLEPSAGSGHIADAIRAAHPGAWIDTIEIASRLRDILVLKNYRVMAFDFLDFENDQERPYDRIVMNPPFERQQDIAHVRMAYSLLAPGGILVTIMSPSFEFRSDRKSTEFRAWLEEVGATWENLPEGSFKASGTGVSTRLLTIERN
jgi:protein-L-isoaspartate O-methyltransferase